MPEPDELLEEEKKKKTAMMPKITISLMTVRKKKKTMS